MGNRTYPSGKPEEKTFGDSAELYYNRRDSALKAMLTDIWGEEGVKTGQSLFRTEDGSALGTINIKAHSQNNYGLTEKSVRDHMTVAAFFEKNPTGNLLIMMKDDNEPHVLSFDQDKHEYSISEKAFVPKPLPPKPSPWDRFIGFLGNKKAKEKVNQYDTALEGRKWYDDFKKKGRDVSKTIERKQKEELEKQKKAKAEEAKLEKKREKERAAQEKIRAEEAKRAKETQKKSNVQEKAANRPQKENPFATNDLLLQEAFDNLKKEMAEKPNLAKIPPEMHTNTKKGLLTEAKKRFGSGSNSLEASNFVMNVARQLVITILGEAPEIQGDSFETTKLNSVITSISRTSEFREVLNRINCLDKDGSPDYGARQEKIREMIKDGGKSLITDQLCERVDQYSDMHFTRKQQTKTVTMNKTNDKVITSDNQNPPILGKR